MCAITGIFDISNCCERGEENRKYVKKMNDCLAHRGPDDEGIVCIVEDGVVFGHRRLSIIDLSENAKQPMVSKNKKLILSYNGEIYNYRSLREELKKKGYKFYSESDTEVVIKAFEYWGISCVEHFNGIFAFAIWDTVKKELYLARDRYGTKPLYYTLCNGKFLFASEYKAFYEYPKFKAIIDLYTLKEYFTFQNVISGRTFLEGVELIKPGCYIKVKKDRDEFKIQVLQYWDFDFREDDEISSLSMKECENKISELLVGAVNRQLVSDVELGSYLSGGIDSGTIAAIASNSIKTLKTFTVGFDLHSVSGMEIPFDEREKAEYMSYLFGTEHYEMVLKSGDMERCISKLVYHVEDPRVGQSYPNLYAAKLASNFVKVVLAGVGSDEIFAGYPWRYYRTLQSYSFDDYINCYYDYWQRLLHEDELKQCFEPVYAEMQDYSTKDLFRHILKKQEYKKQTLQQYINNSLYFEAKTFLHGLLVVEDKLSMAYGLESRVPFLDNELVDFAMHMPVSYKLKLYNENKPKNENDLGKKVDQYYNEHGDGKLILRKVMGGFVPDTVTNLRKQGFSAPDASWFRGESIEYVKNIIYNFNNPIYEFMDINFVKTVFERHLKGIENKRLFIWSIINFNEWLKIFIKRSYI